MTRAHFPITIHELGYREAGTDYRIKRHVHYVHQWYCLVGGEVSMRLAEGELRLQPGQSVLIGPEVVRGPYCTGAAPRYLIAHFTNHQLNLTGMCQRVLDLAPELEDDFIALLRELRQPAFPNPYHLRYALLIRLLIGLRRAGMQPAPAASQLNARARHEVVEQVDAFIRAHLDAALSCERIARAVHVSAPHLNRLLRAHVGMSTNERLIHWRIELAKHSLLESDLSIGQIAQQVGLNSFSYFTKLFTRHVGSSPSAYRREGGRRYNAGGLQRLPRWPQEAGEDDDA
ncbi:MAG: helix-turn-helix domain-containing protein [Planctomycetota bacterium]